ncbi:SUMF1/EgtB/PvdO family nonheme iron enzyme [candidate division KSB1 bacterium]|nr:SUMF1/EgtB/PvdO family nonheme iron enzyme [candidate division KSB1 bacterium]
MRVLFVIFCLPCLCFAQLSLEGKPEFLQGEIVAKRDINSRFCAALQVISKLDGFSYDANNGVVDVEDKPGKDMVYLSPDERMVEIYHSGFEPLRLILSEVGIELKPKQVWRIKISAETTGNLVPVNIITNPEDATIFIDGKEQTKQGTYKLGPGRHHIEVGQNGYETQSRDIEVSTDQTLFEFELAKRVDPVINIDSDPSGVTVWLDGVKLGETPVSRFYPAGQYQLRLEKNGYVDVERAIEITAPATEKHYALERNICWLSVKTSEAARVYLDDKRVRQLDRIELEPSVVEIRVEQSKAEPLARQVVLKRGEHVKVEMIPEVATGTIRVAVAPFEARVELHGDAGERFEATGAYTFTEIPVGHYELTATASGYIEQSETLTLNEDEMITKSLKLEEITIESDVNNSALNKLGVALVLVEGGSFQMGSDFGEYDEEPIHRVSVDDFYMGKTEVTCKQYGVFCDATGRDVPSGNRMDRGSRPVVNVSWNDAVAFCRWLSGETGMTFRLPTEAEWEYAARGGQKSRGYKYSGSTSLDEVAWYTSNSGYRAHTVAEKQANELGLFDMTGNVMEWCRDGYDYDYYKKNPADNPKGDSSSDSRVMRGGHFLSQRVLCHIANRYEHKPTESFTHFGFRLAASVE